MIKTPSGYTAIEDLRVDSNVLSYNFNGDLIVKPITKVSTKTTDHIVIITIGNEKLITAHNQRFYIPSTCSWIIAQDLTAEHYFLSHCSREKPCSIKCPVTSFNQTTLLYDLTIADHHNFCVSSYDITVHNNPALEIAIEILTDWRTYEFGKVAFGVAAGAIGAVFGKIFYDNSSTARTMVKDCCHQAKKQHTPIFHPETSPLYTKNTGYSAEIKVTPKQETYQGKGGGGGGSPNDPDHKQAKKPEFDQASYHHKNSSGRKSPGPKDGQTVLDRSYQVEADKEVGSTIRIGVEDKDIIVFREHAPNKFHGYKADWASLTDDMQKTLKKSCLVTPKRKVK